VEPTTGRLPNFLCSAAQKIGQFDSNRIGKAVLTDGKEKRFSEYRTWHGLC
jgi:hypothetical protein